MGDMRIKKEKRIFQGVSMSSPNNKRPNDQQRLSQDYVAKKTGSGEETGKDIVASERERPVASVQRKQFL
jgi:hypothetical protein